MVNIVPIVVHGGLLVKIANTRDLGSAFDIITPNGWVWAFITVSAFEFGGGAQQGLFFAGDNSRCGRFIVWFRNQDFFFLACLPRGFEGGFCSVWDGELLGRQGNLVLGLLVSFEAHFTLFWLADSMVLSPCAAASNFKLCFFR